MSPGQPIRLSLVSNRSRNPFDTAVMPGRPLSERISAPGGDRARSYSPPGARYTQEEAARKGIDRYIPGQGGRSRTPPPPRRRGGNGGGGGGRRPGARRERDGSNQEGGRGGRGGNGGNARPKKTQEELDAEMEDYFGGDGAAAPAAGQEAGNGNGAAAPAAPAAAPAPTGDDVDMIE